MKWFDMMCRCALLVCVALLSVGCQRSRIAEPLATDYDSDDVVADVNFWHELADRPAVSNDEAFHGLIMLKDGADPHKTYEARVEYLKANKMLDAGFDRPADETVMRGTVAQILVVMLDIKGGLTMQLIGPHPRYATRELIHLRIFQPSSAQQGLSGITFVGIVGRAEAYMEERS